jgi:hypothetical protein
MIIKQLAVFLENKSGRLSEVTETLSEQNINISAFSIADTSDFGILRMITSDPVKAEKVLREKGFSVHTNDVIALKVPHTPGALSLALKIFSNEGIDIEYMYAFAIKDCASVIIRTENVPKAIETLLKHKMELLKASQLYEL